MKSEQKDIAKKLSAVEHDIKMHNTTFDEIMENLDAVLELIEDCGKTYRNAPAQTKRLLNQAIFKRFLIFNDDDVRVEPEMTEPFHHILEPVQNDLAAVNGAKQSCPQRLREAITNTNRHIQEYFGCGDSFEAKENPHSNKSDFFNPKSSSKDLLVEHRGVEPLTSTIRMSRATNCANAPCMFPGCPGKLPRL